MNKYLIPEIDIKKIRNQPEILNKLKENYNMTIEDEYMIKWPGKNGFKAQGTILRIR